MTPVTYFSSCNRVRQRDAQPMQKRRNQICPGQTGRILEKHLKRGSLALRPSGAIIPGGEFPRTRRSKCHDLYGNPTSDGSRALAEGKGLKPDPANGNMVRIEVAGTRIRIWVDGEKIADLRDDKMNETIGGQTLDHGGVSVTWGFESMGWIRNFSAKRL